MITSPRASFSSLEEFTDQLSPNEIVYVHIFAGDPDDSVMSRLSPLQQDERVLLLDVRQDRGFLRGTSIMVDITKDREFVSKRLSELRGLWAWSRRAPIGFQESEAGVLSLMAEARRYRQ